MRRKRMFELIAASLVGVNNKFIVIRIAAQIKALLIKS
jgi:hypothetical protein